VGVVIKRQSHINLEDIPAKRIDGKLVCLNCGERILQARRRKYCSTECANIFFRKHDHPRMRAWLAMHCNWKCYKCGDDVKEGKYVLDHIIPIAIGGAEFDESNLQILCDRCNKEKTAQDSKLIAKQRDIEKKQRWNKTL
jgi:5-methylcytosine-specific restriction endonuclease McrA